MDIENRLDYFEILENKVKPWGRVGYECLICGRKISASSSQHNYMNMSSNFRGLAGNARGAMTNHIKAHMKRGEV